eukprot:TRINITY_DN4324_c0_g1_i3.p1 TRINITY_DN4324_c0_g1~~TRINITY_DN4324_c0_g1_i3.p1  ORF type:complete len:677 (-),score=171.88 TRINITY_DN4324_c0_g1_i3:94-2124(-)
MMMTFYKYVRRREVGVVLSGVSSSTRNSSESAFQTRDFTFTLTTHPHTPSFEVDVFDHSSRKKSRASNNADRIRIPPPPTPDDDVIALDEPEVGKEESQIEIAKEEEEVKEPEKTKAQANFDKEVLEEYERIQRQEAKAQHIFVVDEESVDDENEQEEEEKLTESPYEELTTETFPETTKKLTETSVLSHDSPPSSDRFVGKENLLFDQPPQLQPDDSDVQEDLDQPHHDLPDDDEQERLNELELQEDRSDEAEYLRLLIEEVGLYSSASSGSRVVTPRELLDSPQDLQEISKKFPTVLEKVFLLLRELDVDVSKVLRGRLPKNQAFEHKGSPFLTSKIVDLDPIELQKDVQRRHQFLRDKHSFHGSDKELFALWQEEAIAEVEDYPWEHLRAKRRQYLEAHHRKLLDTFGDSLRFVNQLFNSEFGQRVRRVPAHMPHFIDRSVLVQLQDRWPDLWDATSSHQFRSGSDMQYSFSYFYFLVHQKKPFSSEAIFKELDVDQDGMLNSFELKNLAILLFGDSSKNSHNFEVLRQLLANSDGKINFESFINNQVFLSKLESKITSQPKNKFEMVGSDDVAFLMIRDDPDVANQALNDIREKRNRFICINDNLNHSDSSSTAVLNVVHNFYESLFPLRSEFELPEGVSNPHLTRDEMLKSNWYIALLYLMDYIRDWLELN